MYICIFLLKITISIFLLRISISNSYAIGTLGPRFIINITMFLIIVNVLFCDLGNLIAVDSIIFILLQRGYLHTILFNSIHYFIHYL